MADSGSSPHRGITLWCQWPSCQGPAIIIGSVQELVGPLSVDCGWVTENVWSAISISVAAHIIVQAGSSLRYTSKLLARQANSPKQLLAAQWRVWHSIQSEPLIQTHLRSASSAAIFRVNLSGGKVHNQLLAKMVKRCSWGMCRSDTRYPERLVGGVKFIPFPKWKKTMPSNREKCLRWIKACNRPHEQLNLSLVEKSYSYFICTKVVKIAVIWVFGVMLS